MTESRASGDAGHVDEYRIGIVGPSGCGKSLLVSGFTKLATVQCYHCTSNGLLDRSTRLKSVPGVGNADASACEVISVVVREPGTLGVKLAKHKQYTGFVYVKAFVRNGDAPFELERSGKVAVGDLLIAVNKQNLVHLAQDEIGEILRVSSENESIRVLTFLRPHGSSPQCDDAPSIDVCIPGHAGSEDNNDAAVPHSSNVAGDCCSRWRTAGVSIDGRSCCIEIVDIPGNDPDGALLKSHAQLFDGIIFVYSLDSTSSLLTLEKRFARPVPGLNIGGRGRRNDISNLPLVVVGTAHASRHTVTSDDGLNWAMRRSSQRQLLLSEGNTLCEAWGAPPVVFASLVDEAVSGGPPEYLLDIFRQVIRRVDDMDNPSLFVSPGSTSVLTCLIPICLQNGAILGPADSPADASKNASQHSSGSAAASIEFKRRIRKRPRKFPVIAEPSGSGLVNPSPRSVAAFDSSHPAEESHSASTSGLFGSTASVARATSNKIINFILSSCSE